MRWTHQCPFQLCCDSAPSWLRDWTNEELRAWVKHELNGYDDIDGLPNYRVIGAPAYGHLAGPFGSGFGNIVIAPMLLPENWRQRANEVRLTQPIATLETLTKTSEETLQFPWPGDLLLYMQVPENNPFDGGMVLHGAWQVVARSNIDGLIDGVRNRVLDFALRLEREAPAAGEVDAPRSQVADSVVTHLFSTTIYGDVIGNVATGHHTHQTTGNIKINKGDPEALETILQGWGIPKADVDDLREALNGDPPDKPLDQKPKTAAWIFRLLHKTKTGRQS